eukprot:CAMPEP_0206208176 /NCGR_PEP_ID=MMETSP0166-20121206/16055_1 /ASSEMBLY_ACC=CAM_ASM_000260 /TAXON_ID=95228 /ORGANISM="Vannella robusta, Strain DIVA3 518/3/11/1/6" /LENGTH=318 /DNA_ID=CAMNT_0053629127 /DNA_START=277 /DNA_END=1234 /DNA_ORIENTATION=-
MFGGPEVLEVQSVAVPKIMENQVLVRLEAFGVNPVDTYIRNGTYTFQPNLPYTPGMDGAGVVEKVGENVSDWKCGDRVFLSGSLTGTYAEKTVCESSHLHILPRNIDFAAGAAIYISYATAFVALYHRANHRPGESVLIHGASGGVGLAAVQIARAHGLKVLGTASTETGMTAIEENGGIAFNHSEDGYRDKILESTDNKGVNIIIEMLSNVNLEHDISTLIGARGRIVIVGCRGAIEINPRGMMGKNSSVTGMHLLQSSPEELAETHKFLQAGLETGILKPIVSGTTFTLDTVAEAQKRVIDRPLGTIGKVVAFPNY